MKILIIALLCYLSQGSTQSSIISHTFRLKPNQDLTKELNKFIKANFIKAASVSTCVGVLSYIYLVIIEMQTEIR